MKKLVKNIIRKIGIHFDDLILPYYWIPYNFFNGRTFNPMRITMELTYRCNLKCKMCPLVIAKNENKTGAIDKKLELTTNEIKKFVDTLKKVGVKSVLLTGGEPFLRKDINEIVSYIKSKRFYCSILSNGYFITREHARELVESGVDLISFSMDGPTDVHNNIRGMNNSFQRICKSIKIIENEKKLLKKSLPRIILNCTISALNQEHISEIVEIAHSLGVSLVDYMYLFYTDENKIKATKKEMPVGELKPESQVLPGQIKHIDYKTLIREVNISKLKARKYKIAVGFNPPLKEKEIGRRFFDEHYSFSSKCFYPWYETRLDPYGNVYPCSLDVNMGNIRETSFEEIWNGPKYIEFRNKLREFGLLPMCAKCCKLVYRYWSYLPVIKSKKRKEKDRVAFIFSQFPCYDETFILRELKALKERGLNCLIFSLKTPKDKIIQEDAKEFIKDTIYIPFISFKVILAQVYYMFFHPLRFWSTAFYIVKNNLKSINFLISSLALFPKSTFFAYILKKLNVKHLHGQWATHPTTSAVIISRLTGIPFSFTGHAHDIYVNTAGLKEKMMQTRFVTTCTADNKEYLLKLMNGRGNEKKIIVNYHGVDLEKFNDGGIEIASPRPLIGARNDGEVGALIGARNDEGRFKILSVGSLFPCKGFDVLIDACRILKDKGIDFECTIAGGGPLEKNLKFKIKNEKLEDYVKLTGYITQDRLIPLYKQAEVFALPVRLEIHWGIPNVLLEAMAAKVPVICTHLPSIPELIQEGKTGFIIPEKNPMMLADTLMKLSKDEDLRKEVGEKGYRIVDEKFNLKKNSSRLIHIFEEALNDVA